MTGVLDWEMATVGDPLMDLGGALAYWVEPGDDEFFQQFRRQPSTTPGMWTRWEVVEHYARRTGLDGHAGAVAVLRGVRAVPARGDRPADLVPLRPRPDPQRGVRRLRPGGRVPRAALPPASSGSDVGQVLLVRHGQASWGAADYDVLSPLGERQAAATGAFLAGVRPDAVVHGADAAPAADGRADGRGGRLEPRRPRSTGAGTRWTTSRCWPPRSRHSPGTSTASRTRTSSRPGSRRPPAAGCPARTTASTPSRGRSSATASSRASTPWATAPPWWSRPAARSPSSSRTCSSRRRPTSASPPSSSTRRSPRSWSGRRGHTLVSFNEHGHLPGDLLTYR